tara:strand:+ start:881 stop:1135 length:255 start_codon:yes stop_codon:yes gene_type:complete
MVKKPLILVMWEDHLGSSEWTSIQEVQSEDFKPAVAKTVGFLIHEDEKTLKVADTILDDGSLGGVSLIIKSCIIGEYKVLRKKL